MIQENNMSIDEAYNYLLDQGISIQDLYIYYNILNSAWYYEENNITSLINKIRQNYERDMDCRSLEYHINAVLNDAYDEENIWD